MFLFDKIPPKQFVVLSTILGLLLVDELDANEQNSFGNFLVSIGQSILTNVSQLQTQKAICEKQEEYIDLCKQIEELNAQLCELKKRIN